MSPCQLCKHGNWLPDSSGPDDGLCQHPLIVQGMTECEPLAIVTERLMAYAAHDRDKCSWAEWPPIPGVDP